LRFIIFELQFWFKKKLGNELRLDLDYNLRDRFPKKLGNTVVACYIGVGSISPKADFEETIVDVAKRVKSEINQQLENQEPFMIKELITVSDGKDFNNPENNFIGKQFHFSPENMRSSVECEFFKRGQIQVRHTTEFRKDQGALLLWQKLEQAL